MLRSIIESISKNLYSQPLTCTEEMLKCALLGIDEMENEFRRISSSNSNISTSNSNLLDIANEKNENLQQLVDLKQSKIIDLKTKLMYAKGNLHARGVMEELHLDYFYLEKKNDTRSEFYMKVLKENRKLKSELQTCHEQPITNEEISENLCELHNLLSKIESPVL